ncbi:hypothetical protein Tco_1301173 [Tanacetum coccineum]
MTFSPPSRCRGTSITAVSVECCLDSIVRSLSPLTSSPLADACTRWDESFIIRWENKNANFELLAPDVFNRMPQPHTMQFTNITETSSKDGLTIIECKRGGDVFSDSHSNWLQTVSANPEAMLFKFVPITSLLYRGADILVMRSIYIYAASHSNNPTLEDLQCFLEFQVPRTWAPTIFKLVTGLRLFLEGKKCNRLAMHVQHLSSLPDTITHTLSKSNMTCRPFQLRGSDEYDSKAQFLDPVRWKRYSNICSSVVKRDPNWLNQEPAGGVFIVTGPQLISKGKWPKTILHLRTEAEQAASCNINCGVFLTPHQSQVSPQSFRKYVDTDEVLTELYVTLAEKLHRLAVQLVADASVLESVQIAEVESRFATAVSEFGEIQLHGRVKDGVPHLTKVGAFEVDAFLTLTGYHSHGLDYIAGKTKPGCVEKMKDASQKEKGVTLGYCTERRPITISKKKVSGAEIVKMIIYTKTEDDEVYAEVSRIRKPQKKVQVLNEIEASLGWRVFYAWVGDHLCGDSDLPAWSGVTCSAQGDYRVVSELVVLEKPISHFSAYHS